MHQNSDNELINLIKSGKTEALEELFYRYAQAILNVVYPIVGRQGKAEDATQNTFLAVLEYAHTFRFEGSVKNWLARIATNFAISELRKEKKETVRDFTESEISYESKSNIQLDIVMALQELPEDQRIAITLKKIEGYSYDECAYILEVPAGTVQSRVFLGMKKLSEIMNRNGVKNE